MAWHRDEAGCGGGAGDGCVITGLEVHTEGEEQEEVIRQAGEELDERYKETSLGGLSVSLPEC